MVQNNENIVHAGRPSRTALHVATLRAAHQLLDEPIVFEDPLAMKILDPDTRSKLLDDPFQYNDPLSRGERASLIVRSKFAEDEVAQAVAAGVRQYVVLGAGFDTFAYRNPYEATGLRVFEVDHPTTQRSKKKCLEQAGIPTPGNLVFAPVDFEHEALIECLSAVGFRAELPACVSWLGVTVYLSEDAIFRLLSVVARLSRGSSVFFDYHVPENMLDSVQQAVVEVMKQKVAAFGEPWITTFEPTLLREQCLALGFREAENCEPNELNKRYLFRRKDGLRSGGRILVART
jgi:methyltransferase (TIGR00027 family)